ncbi:hypothetical protein LAZ67_X003373 [Cordylochernes scorpioides]|uniref:Transposase n=1 Tax=Cordylochernes scorpioides TaxID=51811 RepID=A0ABY6LU31_9ARAC|nr:hypothetical protein LAZ67_X003373 [Cordylochernes scorpioides]
MPGHRKRRQFKQTDAFTRSMVIGLKRAGIPANQPANDRLQGPQWRAYGPSATSFCQTWCPTIRPTPFQDDHPPGTLRECLTKPPGHPDMTRRWLRATVGDLSDGGPSSTRAALLDTQHPEAFANISCGKTPASAIMRSVLPVPPVGLARGSLAHRYWSCRAVRPLLQEVFTSRDLPLDFQTWLFGVGLHPKAMKLTSVAKATIYKYHLSLELGNPANTSTCPLCWRELSQSIGSGVFPTGQTVNSVFYLEVLRRLKRRIARVRTDIKDTVKVHHDNATSHTAFIITNFLARSNTSVILHPPYSPDLAPSAVEEGAGRDGTDTKGSADGVIWGGTEQFAAAGLESTKEVFWMVSEPLAAEFVEVVGWEDGDSGPLRVS